MRTLDDFGVLALRALNPGPLTLSGTNSYVVDRDPAYVIDPGPALGAHTEALVEAVGRRGGLGAVALTHDHHDHAEGVSALIERCGPAPVLGAGRAAEVVLTDGDSFGPLRVLATPGHAREHLAYTMGGVGFTGDAVLGEGSVFIAPDPGAMAGYLRALERLRGLGLEVLCPGHGPPIWDPEAKLDEYVAHRLDRECGLLKALDAGCRTIDELLDAAWSDVPAGLRPAATLTLAAHLDKLEGDGLLPPGVQRPSWNA